MGFELRSAEILKKKISPNFAKYVDALSFENSQFKYWNRTLLISDFFDKWIYSGFETKKFLNCIQQKITSGSAVSMK